MNYRRFAFPVFRPCPGLSRQSADWRTTGDSRPPFFAPVVGQSRFRRGKPGGDRKLRVIECRSRQSGFRRDEPGGDRKMRVIECGSRQSGFRRGKPGGDRKRGAEDGAWLAGTFSYTSSSDQNEPVPTDSGHSPWPLLFFFAGDPLQHVLQGFVATVNQRLQQGDPAFPPLSGLVPAER